MTRLRLSSWPLRTATTLAWLVSLCVVTGVDKLACVRVRVGHCNSLLIIAEQVQYITGGKTHNVLMEFPLILALEFPIVV